MLHIPEKIHPAKQWAAEQYFNSTEADCCTAVVLKILDGKCKMLPGEMAAVMEIYYVVRAVTEGELFDAHVHGCIDNARSRADAEIRGKIHELRLYAERHIPKPVMKQFKARLRDGLFG